MALVSRAPPPADTKPPEKELPNFEVSGLLAETSNEKNGIALTFAQPADKAEPTRPWRLFEFVKSSQDPNIRPVNKFSCYLFGKDRRLTDRPNDTCGISYVATDHPSCSKQHAVLQYRLKQSESTPYLMDLDSTNGTFLNGQKVPPQRYVELRDRDILRFGQSSREYILMESPT